MLSRSLSALFAISFTLAACSQGSSPPVPVGPGGDNIAFTGNQKEDWGQIVSLEDQAKALIKAGGCSTASQCRTAAVGSRACGGPRYYLVYCSLTTDSAALQRKLEAVAAAEQAYNQHYQLASTCEFRMPPQVAVVSGSCEAQPATQPASQATP